MPEEDVLHLNWRDFSELRQVIDEAQAKDLLWQDRELLGAAADRAIAGWLQSRGFNSLSRFYLRMTKVVVDPRAERFTVSRDKQHAFG